MGLQLRRCLLHQQDLPVEFFAYLTLACWLSGWLPLPEFNSSMSPRVRKKHCETVPQFQNVITVQVINTHIKNIASFLKVCILLSV